MMLFVRWRATFDKGSNKTIYNYPSIYIVVVVVTFLETLIYVKTVQKNLCAGCVGGVKLLAQVISYLLLHDVNPNA